MSTCKLALSTNLKLCAYKFLPRKTVPKASDQMVVIVMVNGRLTKCGKVHANFLLVYSIRYTKEFENLWKYTHVNSKYCLYMGWV